MATDIDSPSEQSRGRGRCVPSFRRKGDLNLSEQKRGCFLGEVRFEFSNLQLSDVDLTFRSAGVVFANLIFEECSFESGSFGSIVEVENCVSSRDGGTIQFHHVSFRNNILINGAGLAMQSPSCFELELIDFVFETNTCDGHCGVILSRRNRLRDVIIHQNKPFDSKNTNTTVFHAPPRSETSVDRMNSSENGCMSLKVVEGFLNMSRSQFIWNSISFSQKGASNTSLQLKNATASIKDCLYRENEAGYGGAIRVEKNSSGIITDSQFGQNKASRFGGSIYVQDFVLSVQKCVFNEGSAENGGGIYAFSSNVSVEDTFASGLIADKYGGFLSGGTSKIRVKDCSFSENGAAEGGGAIECYPNCSFTDTGSHYSGNSAEFGGGIFLARNSSGIITDSQFDQNKASRSGGSIYVDESVLSVQKCVFNEGSAENGAGIYAFSSIVSVQDTFASGLIADKYGGFLSGGTSKIRVKDCSFSENGAAEGGGAIECYPNCSFTDTGSHYSGNSAEFGGGIFLARNSSGIITDSQFDQNKASRSGGALRIKGSVLSIRKCNFTEGSARNGGGIYASSSNVSIRKTEALHMFASEQGGAFFLSKSVFEIYSTQISQCEAMTNGGAIIVYNLSRLLCSGCTLAGNEASRGGAIFFEYSFTQSISVQLDNSDIFNNSARFGGIHHKTDRVRGSHCSLLRRDPDRRRN